MNEYDYLNKIKSSLVYESDMTKCISKFSRHHLSILKLVMNKRKDNEKLIQSDEAYDQRKGNG